MLATTSVWLYKKAADGSYEVGYYAEAFAWHVTRTFGCEETAAAFVHYLHGGSSGQPAFISERENRRENND